MTPSPTLQAVAVLDLAYGGLIGLVESLDDSDAWRSTGCLGWTVRDVTFHLLGDAQRALVALHTPTDAEPDTDAVTYWEPWQPGTEGADAGRRSTRIMASCWSRYAPLRDLYVETARAVVHAARTADAKAVITTQGRALRVEDFLLTLAVEAAIHHLDAVVDLDRPGPRAESLAVVRSALDGLLGRPVPVSWTDEEYVRAGTGRMPLTPSERRALGDDAARFPLFG